MRAYFVTLLAGGVLLASGLLPAGVASATSPLGESLNDIDVAEHWIYDDFPKALEQAKSSGKPILVVVRCVPCPPGRALDAKVMRPDKELEQVEKQFVCVRLIQANSLDLSLFQYDFDMSWSSMFLNADGTVYGRYGTRNASGPGSDAILSAAAFQKAAERALTLHKAYPGNKAQLAGKRGEPGEYARPTEIPGLKDRPARASVRKECIHCHMVKEFAMRAKWEEGRLSEKDLYVFPMPERIGLTLDKDDGLLVQRVAAGSSAAEAGIAAGDELASLGGQPLTSTADVQWVLNSAPNDVRLPVTLRRKDQPLEKTIALGGDWKKADIAWRASSWYGLRQGVKFEPLTAEEKTRRGIGADKLALSIKNLFGNGGPKVRAAGLQQNDVVVSIDGRTEAMSESDFLAFLRLKHGPKDSVKLTVLRGDRRRELLVPMW